MYVITIIETKGKTDGKDWVSRTAVCVDEFHGSNGSGEYVKTFKCTGSCPIPDADTNVSPLFNERGKVADWAYPDE